LYALRKILFPSKLGPSKLSRCNFSTFCDRSAYVGIIPPTLGCFQEPRKILFPSKLGPSKLSRCNFSTFCDRSAYVGIIPPTLGCFQEPRPDIFRAVPIFLYRCTYSAND
jgi:hypothetical protein